jgi:hypothetical protein
MNYNELFMNYNELFLWTIYELFMNYFYELFLWTIYFSAKILAAL